jgi:predicted nucleic acid-binding protein
VKVALATNVLAYAEGVNGADNQATALEILRRLPQDLVVIPVQVLGELFNVLVRKAGRSQRDARGALLSWRDAFQLIETSSGTMMAAADLATDHQLRIWERSDSGQPLRRGAEPVARQPDAR